MAIRSRGHNRLCYYPFAETWLTVVTRRRQCFPQFELSFSLKVKYQFTFQSSLFIFLAHNRQKHRVSLEKYSPNTTYRHMRSCHAIYVALSCHTGCREVGLKGIFFSSTNISYAVLRFLWINLHFSVVSILNAVSAAPHYAPYISVAGQWLSTLRFNPDPTSDCLRLNNRLMWRTRNIYFIKNIFSTHTLEIHQKLYICASFSVSF